MGWFKRKKREFKDTAKNREYAERARVALAGFIEGDEAASRALVEMVTPLIYKWLDCRHEELMDDWREIQGRCFLVLVEWRHAGRLDASEPLPFLARRVLKQVVRDFQAKETRQERVAEAWVKDPRPAPVKADQALDASRFEQRVWALAKEKMSAAHVEALEAYALEQTGVAPMEETLRCGRVAARKRAARARAEMTRLAEEAGLLDDLHWAGQGEAVVTDNLIEGED
jgi:hypothetical protein